MIGERTVSLVGIIKGSGMIMPDMATMLGFIFTDAAVDPAWLQSALSHANAKSFSCITVDSDTSTSDTVLAFATGAAGNVAIAHDDDPGADAFRAALDDLCLQLAHLVVRDGEGASKFIRIDVTGAESDASAHRIGMSDRQLAAGQDRDRRRGRQLGPRRDGGRQGRRARRARQARDPLRRDPGGEGRAGGRRAMTRRRSPRT